MIPKATIAITMPAASPPKRTAMVSGEVPTDGGGSVGAGTVCEGTVGLGTVCEGTVGLGTVSEGTVGAGSVTGDEGELNISTQAFPVTALSCMGHCLLKATLKPSTMMEGLSWESIHMRSMSSSVEAVSLPSESEYTRSAVRYANSPDPVQFTWTFSMSAASILSHDGHMVTKTSFSELFSRFWNRKTVHWIAQNR